MILCIFQGKSFTLINALKDISSGPELLVLADSSIPVPRHSSELFNKLPFLHSVVTWTFLFI